MKKPLANPRRTRNATPSTTVAGRRVKLTDTPLVAYTLECGHSNRDYAVRFGDHIFCDTCGTTKRVTHIIAE